MANVPITSLPEATSPSANDYLILQGKNTQRIKWSALLDKLYPVGCIYQSASSTSPASFLGGTWERIKDRFILAAGDAYAAGSIGGAAAVKLTIDEIALHSHKQQLYLQNGYSGNDGKWNFEEYGYFLRQSNVVNPDASSYTGKVSITRSGYTDNTGGSKPHNNMPPYIAKYVWQRIA